MSRKVEAPLRMHHPQVAHSPHRSLAGACRTLSSEGSGGLAGEGPGAHDYAGGAETALEGSVIDERLLQGGKFACFLSRVAASLTEYTLR